MTALLKNIFTVAPDHKSNKEIIHWWEQRRLFYNIVMLAAGLVTISLAVLLGEITYVDLIKVLPPVLFVAFSANLFYTMGWIVEIACHKFIAEKVFIHKAGPVLLISGISLSLCFTIAIDIALLIAFFLEK